MNQDAFWKDLEGARQLLAELRMRNGAVTVDFEEAMQLEEVQSTLRIWRAEDGSPAAFVYVDAYANFCFEVADPAWLHGGPISGLHGGPISGELPQREAEMVGWAIDCIRQRGESALDACCGMDEGSAWRHAFLLRHGFVPQAMRSLHYARPLMLPLADCPLPEGFVLRPVQGEAEVEALVELHRAAFGTDHMTVEERLAIMRAPGYLPRLDLLIVAPNGQRCAFCICGWDVEQQVAYTDPIGVHPDFQGRSLGRVILTAALRLLMAEADPARKPELMTVEVGTSSENLAMQRLAEAVGFRKVSETAWFSLAVQSPESGE